MSNSFPASFLLFDDNKASGPDVLRLNFCNEKTKKQFGVKSSQDLIEMLDSMIIDFSESFERISLKKVENLNCKDMPLSKYVVNIINDSKLISHQESKPTSNKLTTKFIQELRDENDNKIKKVLKFRAVLISFYRNNKLSFVLILEDRLLEEEIIRLKEIDKMKDEMFASISHDLRSPLSSVIKWIEIAKLSHDIQQIHKNLVLAENSGNMLMILINDLLDYSSMKNGKFKINSENFSLHSLLENVIDMMKIQVEMKGISLTLLNKCPKNLSLHSDHIRIKQVLFNLIGNSLKFTKKNGTIKVKTKYLPSNLVKFSIIDNGIGIKPEILPKLCKPFQTFDYNGNYNKHGIGLGLHICKMIVKELGPYEKLEIKSEFNKGSKFSFYIYVHTDPKQKKEIKEDDKLPENLFLLKNFNKFLINDSREKTSSPPGTDCFLEENEKVDIKNIPYKSKIRIITKKDKKHKSIENIDMKIKKNSGKLIKALLVDDDVFNHSILEIFIDEFIKETDCGFLYENAYNGIEAEKLFQKYNSPYSKEAFNLIFMDGFMPLQDGYITSKNIKELIHDYNFKNCKIIGCTALFPKENIPDNGMDQILQKPFEKESIFQIFKNVLQEI